MRLVPMQWHRAATPVWHPQMMLAALQVSVDEKLQLKPGVPPRWYNAVIPIGLVVLFMLLGLILTGRDSVEADGISMSVQNIFGNGDPFSSLLWATFTVSLLSWVLYRVQYHHDGQVQPFWSKHKDAKPFMTLSGALPPCGMCLQTTEVL